ncbi:LysR family transcriptional regulator [Uliginosibacterium sp. 31-16]|uniref:LysR family transcriptional regulator n=1 Tax=Uliginosibacterium sp. 31-16 TaxID=3068315 RepID=UPI00273FA3FE|nr:LysR family transcriptional regulator [Uliginosibacterium sp. 31-16]MDP5239654.1 LysR family transcriptional regulator [Uliginosibacterium sp. 31-16]
MDLKRLRYFCTIAEEGQVSRAAAVLHMAQPPLSQRLRELELELGCALFLRKGRTLQLTEAGQLFYRRAREILRSVEEARDEVVRLASQDGPTLRLGLSPTGRNFWLSNFPALRTAFPGRQIGLIVGDSSYLEYLLQARQLDAALMQAPSHPENFHIHRLNTCKTVAVVPAGMLGTERRALSLAELGMHPLLLLRRSIGVGSYERLLKAFHEAGLQPNIALYSSDVEILLDLLEQGFAGIAVVPETETRQLKGDSEVWPIALELPDYELSLVCRSSDPDEATMSLLIQVLQGSADSP